MFAQEAYELLPDLAALAPEGTLLAAAGLCFALARAKSPRAAALTLLAFVLVLLALLVPAGYAWIDAEYTLRPENPALPAFGALALVGGAVCVGIVRRGLWPRVATFTIVVAWLLALHYVVERPYAFDAGVVHRVFAAGPESDASLLRLDAFASVGRALLLLCMLLAWTAPGRGRADARRGFTRAALVASAHAGACIAVATENMLVAWLGLELAAASCLAALAAPGDGAGEAPRRRWASLALGLPASALLLAGFALLFWVSGAELSLHAASFDAVGLALEELEFEGPRAWWGCAAWLLLCSGLAAKAGLAPFSSSFRARLAAAPAPARVTMILSVRVAVLCLWMRVLMALSGAWSWTPAFTWVVLAFALASASAGAVSALRSARAADIAPPFTLASFGFAMFAVASFYLFERDEESGEVVSSFASDQAVQAALWLLLNTVLFYACARVVRSARDGPARTRRLCCAAALFGLVPGTAGFFAHVELQRAAAAQAAAVPLAPLLVLYWLLTFFAFLLVARRFAREPQTVGEAPSAGEAAARVVAFACAAGALLGGLFPSALVGIARAAALGLRL